MMFFFFQAEDGIRDKLVTGVQTCALPISLQPEHTEAAMSVVMGERTSAEVAGKRVAVIGLGRSGVAAVRLLGELGARVAVADQKPLAALTTALEGLRAGDLEVHGSGAYERALRGAELGVVSPGVSLTL